MLLTDTPITRPPRRCMTGFVCTVPCTKCRSMSQADKDTIRAFHELRRVDRLTNQDIASQTDAGDGPNKDSIHAPQSKPPSSV